MLSKTAWFSFRSCYVKKKQISIFIWDVDIGSGNGMAPNKRPGTIWSIDSLAYWRIYGPLGLGESKMIV